MRIVVPFDIETTGIPLWKDPSDHPDQPHIVQIAAHMVDIEPAQPRILQSINLIVKPDGWQVEHEDIHGISHDMAMQVGVSEQDALITAMHLMGVHNPDGMYLRVAHNQTFDARILRIALKRYELMAWAEKLAAGPKACTANMSRPICALPPTDKMRGGHKTPTLEEAYYHFYGKHLEDAHTALADVNACLDVYLACLRAGGDLASAEDE